MQKALRREGTKIPAFHGTEGLVFTDGSKAEAFAEAIDNKQLTWKKHIKTAIEKVKATTAKLYPLLNRRSQISIRNKLLLIKTIIRPTLAYASTASGYAAEDLEEPLREFLASKANADFEKAGSHSNEELRNLMPMLASSWHGENAMLRRRDAGADKFLKRTTSF
ncbi:hypothetical protein D910_10959 [Dendroctonus ponderosae]|uniref:Uncharacterized protein n=1 Tax=Dendroctonus ponderosae TaxID=77166 RepID=U4UTZ6_DENPD|nr:hypothetical protein D910_10959 [Dendroctonus ponderosae]